MNNRYHYISYCFQYEYSIYSEHLRKEFKMSFFYNANKISFCKILSEINFLKYKKKMTSINKFFNNHR
jgi:hypothetical protein